MDSSDLQSTNSTGLMSSNIADNTSMITPSKRDIFLSTYRRQNFTLPNSIIYFIIKNQKNKKFYQKMIKICKYFFIRNPILIIDDLFYNQNRWETLNINDLKNVDINTISAKLWITDILYVYPEKLNKNFFVSSIIPKIYQCDAQEIYISHQVICYREFIILCSSAEVLIIKHVTVKNEDGTEIAFEKVIEQLPNVSEINYTFTTPSNNISKNTFKELSKIPHLSEYIFFTLCNIPEDFDIYSFYSYMKKYKNTHIHLKFSETISQAYKTRVETIINEIIATKNREYKVPSITFPKQEKDNNSWYSWKTL